MKTSVIVYLVLSGVCSLPVVINGQVSLDSLKKETASAVQEKMKEIEIPGDVAGAMSELISSLGLSQMNLASKAKDALGLLNSGDDIGALEALGTLASAGLSAEQTELFRETKVLVDAYLLKKNIATVWGAEGAVLRIMSDAKSGNYLRAGTGLQALAVKAKLTPEQKKLMSLIKDMYRQWGKEDR